MRRLLIALCLPALLGSVVVRADEAAIREKLRKKVQVEFDKTSLHDALEYFTEETGVNFWIAQEEIEEDGGSTDIEITANFGEMQADSALYLVLERMHGLTAVPGEFDATITTTAKSMERVTTRVYDISKIVDGMQSQWRTGPVSPKKIREVLTQQVFSQNPAAWRGYLRWFRDPSFGARGSTGGMGQGMFQFGGMGMSNYWNGYPPTIGEVADPVGLHAGALTRLALTSHVAMIIKAMTDECFDCEGVSGTLTITDDTLVINSFPVVHDQVEGLVEAMTRMYTDLPTPVFQWAWRPGYPARHEEAVREALQQPGSLEVRSERLDAALDKLARQAGFRYWIDREAIEEDGGDVDFELLHNLGDQTYEEMLKKVLKPGGLDYVIEEGVLIITTEALTYNQYYPAVYNTSEIPEADSQNLSPSRLASMVRAGRFGDFFGDEDDPRHPSLFVLTPSIMVINQTQKGHRQIARFLQDLRQRKRKPAAAKEPELKPKYLTRVYPVFDTDAVEPSVKILKTLLADDELKMIEVVKDSIVIQCSDVGHIRAESYFEAIESAHRRRHERVGGKAEPTPAATP